MNFIDKDDINKYINDELLNTLIIKKSDHMHNNIEYKYIGKGYEAVVYYFIYHGIQKVLKIYILDNPSQAIREFYVIGFLNDLMKLDNNTNKYDNIIKIDNYYLSYKKPIMLMEKLDGDLTNWGTMMMNTNTNIIDNDTYDTMWLSMLFQVAYGITIINRLGILHYDLNIGNIMYLKNDNKGKSYEKYTINDGEYTIPTNYIFKLGDFSWGQIIGSKLNDITDTEIENEINNRSDLYEVSRILFRFLVNHGLRDYGWNTISNILKTNREFRHYHDNLKTSIYDEFKDSHIGIKNKKLLRGLLYHAIETNLIDSNEIIRKHNMRMPSNKVIYVLDNLLNPEIKNVFDLFHMFKI